MDLGLDGRVVLVVGGSGGAGPTIARAFAAEGASVAVHYRSSAERAERAVEAIRGAGGRGVAVGADLSDPRAARALVESVGAALGPVDVLVTATSAYRQDRFVDLEEEAWAAIVDDLLGAVYRACRAVAPGMVERGWGRIVLISSRSGLVGVARAAHYGAAKAGLVGLARSLAKELGPSGVLVNAVAPVVLAYDKDGQPSVPPERADEMARGVPLRRLATPDDLARVVVWLGSAANTYVTGEVVSLTGGARS